MKRFDVIVVGGSYAGLSAAMALGRSLKTVLVIDNGKPCNGQTPHSHNFLTQDGSTPEQIATLARQQVAKYGNVSFFSGLAIKGSKISGGFAIELSRGEIFESEKLVLATGIRDILPATPGFADCWGISILHCPYCHGYEVKGLPSGILGNGDTGYEMAVLISNWTKDLTLFTDGPSTLTDHQVCKLEKYDIRIQQAEISSFEHNDGQLNTIRFRSGHRFGLSAIYTRLPFEQHSFIQASLGWVMTEDGYIQVDAFQQTSVEGVYACGDNVTRLRTVSGAVAMGTTAGISLSRKMIMDGF